MNNYIGQGRKRNQTLLVVEGNHEKNKLFWLILQSRFGYIDRLCLDNTTQSGYY